MMDVEVIGPIINDIASSLRIGKAESDFAGESVFAWCGRVLEGQQARDHWEEDELAQWDRSDQAVTTGEPTHIFAVTHILTGMFWNLFMLDNPPNTAFKTIGVAVQFLTNLRPGVYNATKEELRSKVRNNCRAIQTRYLDLHSSAISAKGEDWRTAPPKGHDEQGKSRKPIEWSFHKLMSHLPDYIDSAWSGNPFEYE